MALILPDFPLIKTIQDIETRQCIIIRYVLQLRQKVDQSIEREMLGFMFVGKIWSPVLRDYLMTVSWGTKGDNLTYDAA